MIIREVEVKDLMKVLQIYNQGIEDRIATLETRTKDQDYIHSWFLHRQGRYVGLVAEDEERNIVGWAAISPYNPRDAYRGVGEISVYIHRDFRGKGIGQRLLKQLEIEASNHDFYKLVLFTFPFNSIGQGLYNKLKYRQVGIFKNQGILDGEFVDVMAMEKILGANC
ncbi:MULTISPECIES: arsinothricin resistance N-acetyltransferase ArsN1 family A [Bacillaceae]|jgi:phosphinothricin acetyltransferase|uniref:N-acetyltransferase n=1 Tax=Cytobacillus stercorigallinarum TaxID=2762240 RepID=A0ABR8QPX2_9BACI|nr:MULTISPECIES: arsinothricin resistance N-acetyltransferase ArsN1 family A [Bacillaceae]MBD7937590.1 N-acetyltransferase [Cytobacillus stercorigallinarum]MCC3359649.1 arsinothricin resistance N-acetyltransferase ArsN1 [Bacillus sp. REN16]MCM3363012.1 arsinothricin resistance N-acetyltransferase ArsN1 [Niallia sp. MER TA 168]MCM3443705.1 arsinothricin resistance N-acetyltransferase ArsN1 [Metabacillus halosaccharovorans]